MYNRVSVISQIVAIQVALKEIPSFKVQQNEDFFDQFVYQKYKCAARFSCYASKDYKFLVKL
ncbi:hypothetical protein ABE61_05700 [Lysinibacillus sphaericus]|nr:hypothetical protein [Lysinibacillus sphaericus]MBG9480277.1 hypothetical protein [Lysinibacillus sphaericus]MBG9594956.1 hypothetical protein [Lysinibacillus sphaericus]